MITEIKKCPGCKKKVVALWEQIHGMRMVHEIKGKKYLSAKCPECGHVWEVKQK